MTMYPHFYLYKRVLNSGLLFLVIQILFLPMQLNAQCPFASNSCLEAIPLVCGTISGQLEDIPPQGRVFPGCPSNSIDNPTYYSFEVFATQTITVTVTPTNCQGSGAGGGLGFQAGLYEDCNPNSPNYGVQCACTSGGIVFTAILSPGTYYVVVDGCAADICDYDIDISPPPASIPVSTPATPTASNLTPCPFQIVTLSVPAVPAATNYTWVLPNGVFPIGSPPYCNSITVFWGQNSGSVSVVASNDCSLPSFSPALLLEVLSVEGYEYGSYCFPEEAGYYHAGTQTLYPSSIDIPWFTANGCDSTIHLVVSQFADSYNQLNVKICEGEETDTIGGHLFNAPTDTTIILDGLSHHGCDSIINLSVQWASSNYLRDTICSGGSILINGTLYTNAVDTLLILPGIGTSCPDSFIYINVVEQYNAEISDILVTSADCDSTGGSAAVVLSADSSNVNYSWSIGGTASVQQNLPVGEYSVTVQNFVSGCVSHKNFEVDLDSSCYVLISGYVLNDSKHPDCIEDSETIGVPNVLITLSNGMMDFTDQNGYYEFKVLPGNYTAMIDWNGNIYNSLCTAPISIDAITLGNQYAGNNFYLNFILRTDIAIKVSKLNPRPGFIQFVRICVMNYGNVPADWTLRFVHDSLQIYEGADIVPDNYNLSTQTLSWNFTDHQPGSIIIFNVDLFTPANISVGTLLDYFFSVSPTIVDIDLSNNQITSQCEVVNRYDPNDKQVLPLGEGPLGGIKPAEGDSLLSYHIRFQNTGTDTAYTVIVRDTLDSDLSIRDVVPGPSSHMYDLDVIGDNVLEFRFENIYLPDSNVNEQLSHGFLFYDVKLKRDLPVGTEINNRAAIYFDFNAPVITNTVSNTIFGADVTTLLTIEGCDEVTYNGQVYQQNTVISNTYDLIYYDSIVIAELIVNPEYDITVNVTLDPGDLYEGNAYAGDTIFVKELMSQQGCDSTVTVVIDVLTTGVKLFGNELINVGISPNPSFGIFNVAIESSAPLSIRWKLVNTTGMLINSGSWDTGHRAAQQLDMSAQPSGLYILLLESEGAMVTQKLVKY